MLHKIKVHYLDTHGIDPKVISVEELLKVKPSINQAVSANLDIKIMDRTENGLRNAFLNILLNCFPGIPAVPLQCLGVSSKVAVTLNILCGGSFLARR